MRILVILTTILTLGACNTIDRAGERAEIAAEKAIRLAGEEMRTTTTQAVEEAGEQSRQIVAQAGQEARGIIEAASVEAGEIVAQAGKEARQTAQEVGVEARSTVKLAAAESKALLADAAHRIEHVGEKLIGETGDRLDQSIDHLGDRTDESVTALADRIDAAVDRAGDRGEAIVARTELATTKAREDAEGFLDYLKSWWMAVIGILMQAVTAFFLLKKRAEARRAKRAAETVVQAVEDSGADEVKRRVSEELAQAADKDRAELRKLIEQLAKRRD